MFKKLSTSTPATTPETTATQEQTPQDRQPYVVVPGALTGASPIFLNPSSICEVQRSGAEVVLLTASGDAIRLATPNGSSASVLNQVIDLVFGENKERVMRLASITQRYINPLAIDSLAFRGGGVSLTFKGGKKMQLPALGGGSFEAFAEALYGPQAALEAKKALYVAPVEVVDEEVAPPKILTQEEMQEMRDRAESARELAVEQNAEKAKRWLDNQDRVRAANPENRLLFVHDVLDELQQIFEIMRCHEMANYNQQTRAVVLNIKKELDDLQQLPAAGLMNHSQYTSAVSGFAAIREFTKKFPGGQLEKVKVKMLSICERINVLPEIPKEQMDAA